MSEWYPVPTVLRRISVLLLLKSAVLVKWLGTPEVVPIIRTKYFWNMSRGDRALTPSLLEAFHITTEGLLKVAINGRCRSHRGSPWLTVSSFSPCPLFPKLLDIITNEDIWLEIVLLLNFVPLLSSVRLIATSQIPFGIHTEPPKKHRQPPGSHCSVLMRQITSVVCWRPSCSVGE